MAVRFPVLRTQALQVVSVRREIESKVAICVELLQYIHKCALSTLPCLLLFYLASYPQVNGECSLAKAGAVGRVTRFPVK